MAGEWINISKMQTTVPPLPVVEMPKDGAIREYGAENLRTVLESNGYVVMYGNNPDVIKLPLMVEVPASNPWLHQSFTTLIGGEQVSARWDAYKPVELPGFMVDTSAERGILPANWVFVPGGFNRSPSYNPVYRSQSYDRAVLRVAYRLALPKQPNDLELVTRHGYATLRKAAVDYILSNGSPGGSVGRLLRAQEVKLVAQRECESVNSDDQMGDLEPELSMFNGIDAEDRAVFDLFLMWARSNPYTKYGAQTVFDQIITMVIPFGVKPMSYSLPSIKLGALDAYYSRLYAGTGFHVTQINSKSDAGMIYEPQKSRGEVIDSDYAIASAMMAALDRDWETCTSI